MSKALRTLAMGLAWIMLAGGAWAEDTGERVPALALPEPENGEFAVLTAEEDPMIGPHAEGYILDEEGKTTGYRDPSITVNTGKGRIYNTNYAYARVKIADANQIRTTMTSESLSGVKTVPGSTLAERVRAVTAVNGVLEADVSSGGNVAFVDGPVVRQRVWKRPGPKTSEAKVENWKTKPALDTLVIDMAGDLVILEGETWGEIMDQVQAMGDSAVNVITFGPALVVDGAARYGYTSRQMSTHKPAQRMAICQTGPLEYLLITSEGPENTGSKGLTLEKFTELVASFPEVQTAYNLDGGTSSTLVFRKGDDFWAKINSPGGKIRPLRDLIYFADAWIPDEPPAPEAEETGAETEGAGAETEGTGAETEAPSGEEQP